MKHRAAHVISGFAGMILLAAILHATALAGEKTGNLVFNAMQKMQETHQAFLGNLKKIKDDRKAAVANRDVVRERYQKAEPGSMDQREFHARYSYILGKVYRSLYDEAKLTHQVAGKQIGILNKLNDAVPGGGSSVSDREVAAVVATAKPILENGRSLLASLSVHRGIITDPIINAKLNGAAATARVLSDYVKQMGNGTRNRHASQRVLKQKVGELVEQLNAIYVQTDIFLALLRDKTTLLKLVNQLAASEAAILAISDGNSVLEQISGQVMAPMMDLLKASDDDLNSLMGGAAGNGGKETVSGGSQRWADQRF